MRIAVYHNLPVGGAKRVLFEQVNYLSKNHDIYIYETEQNNMRFDIKKFAKHYRLFELKEIKIPLLPERLKKDYQQIISSYNANKKIAEKLNSKDVDVVFIHTDKNTEAPYLLRFLDKPSLYYDQEILAMVYCDQIIIKNKLGLVNKAYDSLYKRIRKTVDSNNASYAKHTATNSKYMQSFIKNTYGLKSQVCYPGVNTQKFKRQTNRINYVLFTGDENSINYNFMKKIEHLVQVKIKTLSSLNKVNDKKIAEMYSGAIATLCLVPFEAFGLKAIESSACESPVIALDKAGYKETVIDEVTGFLLPRDPQAFADKINWLMVNPDKAREMGKAGREHVKKNFTWERHNKCIENLLVKIANAEK